MMLPEPWEHVDAARWRPKYADEDLPPLEPDPEVELVDDELDAIKLMAIYAAAGRVHTTINQYRVAMAQLAVTLGANLDAVRRVLAEAGVRARIDRLGGVEFASEDHGRE